MHHYDGGRARSRKFCVVSYLRLRCLYFCVVGFIIPRCDCSTHPNCHVDGITVEFGNVMITAFESERLRFELRKHERAHFAPLPSSSESVVAPLQGLTVYCAVSVAGADYPCSLSTFSAPGNGRAVIAPISAPLHLVESPGLPGKISPGCGQNDASAAAATAGGIGAHDDPSTGATSATAAEPAQSTGWRRWLRRVRKLSEAITARHPRSASDPIFGRAAAAGRHGTSSGSIFVVSRGECTFEEKVGSARCWCRRDCLE